jgi:hypothetical protein
MSDEHLTDGWEPDLPVSDTLLRRFLFNLAAFHEVPAAAAGARTLRRDDFTAADLGRPAAMHNAATLLRPLPFDRPGDTLDAVEEFFGGGRGEAYLWSAWPTPDLRPRGWVLEGHPPLLLRLPGSQPPPPGAPPGLRIERVAGVDGLRDWERVAVDGFPYRELQPWRPGALLEEPGLPAVGVFSDMSRPGAEALGFLPITRFTLWHRPRPARSR